MGTVSLLLGICNLAKALTNPATEIGPWPESLALNTRVSY